MLRFVSDCPHEILQCMDDGRSGAVDKNSKQALLNLLRIAHDTFLPFYQRLNTLNRNKSTAEGKFEWGAALGFVLGISLAIFAYRLSIRFGEYVLSFYDGYEYHPAFFSAPVWVELLLFFGGLLFIIISLLAPAVVIICLIHKVTRAKHNKITAEIDSTWNELIARIANWSDCPVTLHYSHPQWITAIYNAVDSGRADSIEEAIHVLEADERHNQFMNAQIEAQRVFQEDLRRKRQKKEAEEDFQMLFWLNEMNI